MTVNEKADAFDKRLKALRTITAPGWESEAAITTYERLRTAQAIACSVLSSPSNSDILAIFSELASESRVQAARLP